MSILSACVVIAILNIAMIMDIFTGKIRNCFILIGFCSAISCQIFEHRMSGIANFAFGAGVAVLILFSLFALGFLGAGDVKLFAVVGGFLGARGVILCIMISFLLGAVYAVWKMVWRRNMKERFQYFCNYLKTTVMMGKIEAYGQSFEEEQAVLHFSPGILFAVIIYLGGNL